MEMTRALPDVDVVIMRMEKVPYIDQSGMYAIEDAVMVLQDKHVLVLFEGIQSQPEDMLRRIGLIPDMVANQHLFEDFTSCVTALESGEAFKDVVNKEDYAWTFITR